MTELSAIISALNFLGLGGVGIFIYYLFKGLSQKIKTLTEISLEQEKTLAVVRERALEMEKWREEYKKIINDFHELGAKLDTRRNELVRELEEANRKKDSELAALKTAQLQEIELRQQSYKKVQDLEKELQSAKAERDRQLHILQPGELGKAWANFTTEWLTTQSCSPYVFEPDLIMWPKQAGGPITVLEFKDEKPGYASGAQSPDETKKK